MILTSLIFGIAIAAICALCLTTIFLAGGTFDKNHKTIVIICTWIVFVGAFLIRFFGM